MTQSEIIAEQNEQLAELLEIANEVNELKHPTQKTKKKSRLKGRFKHMTDDQLEEYREPENNNEQAKEELINI
jgi:hypothetical protein